MPHKVLPHIIHRQVLELHLPPNRYDGNLEDRIKRLLYGAGPTIENIFSLYDNPECLTRIDHLSIDLGVIDQDKIDELFASRLCAELSMALSKAVTNNGEPNIHNNAISILQDWQSNHHIQLPDDSLPGEISTKKIGIVKKISADEGISQAFFYFLQNGVFPWWMSEKIEEDVDAVFSLLLDSPSAIFIKELKTVLTNDRNALKRLIYQFKFDFINKVIHLLEQDCKPNHLSFYKAIQQHWFQLNEPIYKQSEERYGSNTWLSFDILLADDPKTIIEIWVLYMREAIRNSLVRLETIKQLQEEPIESWREEIQLAIRMVLISDCGIEQASTANYPIQGYKLPEGKKIFFPENNEKEEPQQDEAIDKIIYVDHAGLVILHSFLLPFFSELGLLNEERQFKDEDAQVKAVHLLAFLASGNMDQSETTLPFCKFLCGMDLRRAITKNKGLNKKEIEECEQLLNATITHWAALKATSIDGLREGFLNRRGKLDFREEGTVLFVETKAHDILLERLPWTISFVHLPWMNKPFTTIWN